MGGGGVQQIGSKLHTEKKKIGHQMSNKALLGACVHA